MLGSIAFSGKAIIVKLAYRYGVDAVTLIMYRMLFALPLFALLAWWAGRGRDALTRRDWLVVTGLGFSGYYLASFLDFAGLAYITAGLERLILYLNPTLVLAIGVVVFRRRPSRRQLVALAVSYCGVLVAFGHEISFQGGGAVVGGALVFASAISYAIYLVASGEEVKRLGALRLTGLATTIACFFCIAQFFVLRPASLLVQPMPVYGLSLVNGIFCTIFPVFMTMAAVQRIGATTASQAGMIGPVSTLFLGWALLGEPITTVQLAGTGLVLGGIYLLSLKN